MIPKDPVMLLSYVNTQLRDFYRSLDAFCEDRGLNRKELEDKLDIIDYAYDPVYGARPLKRYLQNYVETLTAKKILSGDVHAGDTIVLDVKDGEFTVSTK